MTDKTDMPDIHDRPDMPDHNTSAERSDSPNRPSRAAHDSRFARDPASTLHVEGTLEFDQLDLLSSPRLNPLWNRVVDGHESDGEWRAFVSLADEAPALWRELAWSQRESRLLCGAVASHIDGAGIDAFLVPNASDLRGVDAEDSTRRGGSRERVPGRWRLGSGAGLGWALAACVTGAWVLSVGTGWGTGVRSAARSGVGGPQAFERDVHADAAGNRAATASPEIARASFLNPNDALQAYLEMGQKSGAVVGELPGKPVLEKRALDNGDGFEVIFVRQIIERSRVPAMYQFDQSNEFGGIVPTPVRSSPGGGSV